MKLGEAEYAILFGLPLTFVGIVYFAPGVAFGVLTFVGGTFLLLGFTATILPWLRIWRNRNK